MIIEIITKRIEISKYSRSTTAAANIHCFLLIFSLVSLKWLSLLMGDIFRCFPILKSNLSMVRLFDDVSQSLSCFIAGCRRNGSQTRSILCERGPTGFGTPLADERLRFRTIVLTTEDAIITMMQLK